MWVAVGFGLPAITVVLIVIYGLISDDFWLVGSGAYVLMSMPYVISLCLIIYGSYVLLKHEASRRIKYSVFLIAVGMPGWGWSFYINEILMHPCVFGACA